MASPIGLGMLGLEKPPPAPKLATTFKVQPDLSVFAGAGLPYQKILPLFRYGIVKRIDQVYEFKLDRRRFTQVCAVEGSWPAARHAPPCSTTVRPRTPRSPSPPTRPPPNCGCGCPGRPPPSCTTPPGAPASRSTPSCRASGRCCCPATAGSATWSSVPPCPAGHPSCPAWSRWSACSSTRCPPGSTSTVDGRSGTGCVGCRRAVRVASGPHGTGHRTHRPR